MDNKGYLKDISKWNKDLAEIIAKNEKIILSKEHWKVVYFVRDFYLKFNVFPSMRVIVKVMQNDFNAKKINSCYLYRLFPKGPVRQVAKIAGLPEPVRCI